MNEAILTVLPKKHQILLLMDAVGLGVFTVIGASLAKESGISWYGVIFMGVMTGTVGGMTRDILRGVVPLVLRREIYASASILGGTLFLILDALKVICNLNIFISACLVIGLRTIAIIWGWHLPKAKDTVQTL